MAVNNLVDSPFPVSPTKGGTGLNNGANTLSVTGNSVINQDVSTAGTPAYAQMKITTGFIDTNNNMILAMTPVASAVNSAQIVNAATGGYPFVASVGTDTNIGLGFYTKGTGVFNFLTNGGTGNSSIRLYNAAQSAFVGINCPSGLGAFYGVNLPTAQGGAGTVMQNDGGGNLSWVSNGGAQGVLQVVQASLNTTFTSTGATDFTDITGLSLSITPSTTSSRILIFANVVMRGNVTQTFPLARLVRGTTPLFVGTGGTLANGSGGSSAGLAATGASISFNYVDSPASTSALTYKLQGVASSAIALGDFDVNIVRTATSVGSSSIIAIEIAS